MLFKGKKKQNLKFSNRKKALTWASEVLQIISVLQDESQFKQDHDFLLQSIP